MPVKVLLYVRGLEEGGTERQVERLARGLNRDRFETAVAYSRPWGPVGDRLRADGIPVIGFSDSDRAEAESAIREIAPDIFHSFTHKDAVDLAAAHAAGVPQVVASRRNIREWDERLEVRPWEVERNRLSHRITAVSEAAASLCAEVEGVARQRIEVIHNGVDIPEFEHAGPTIREQLGIDSHAPTIGYVANYRPEKGHEGLLQSFRRVVNRRPDAQLICCGIMTQATGCRLAALARDLGLESNVALLQSRPDVSAVYRGLDMYVHPSRWEGFSNALLEAMSYALPVAATNVGGTAEAVVDGVTGLLVANNDAEALAEAMLELLADPERARKLGGAGRARVARHFPMKGMVDAYAHLYEAAPRGRG